MRKILIISLSLSLLATSCGTNKLKLDVMNEACRVWPKKLFKEFPPNYICRLHAESMGSNDFSLEYDFSDGTKLVLDGGSTYEVLADPYHHFSK